MDPVTVLQNAHDASRRAGIVIHLGHRLVEVWIEGRAESLDAFDAKSPQRRLKLALGRANAIEKHGVARRLVNPILHRGDRPLQIICDRQKLGRKVGDRVFARIRRASFGAASRVLDFRQSPEQAVAQGSVLVRSLDRGAILAVGREAFARQMDFVVLNHRAPFGLFPLHCRLGARTRTRKRAFSSPCDGRRRLP